MQPWLTIVGIGDDGIDSLGTRARNAVTAADVIIGGTRHLDLLPPSSGAPQRRMTWPTPFNRAWEQIKNLRGQNVCILATGNPMLYGVGVQLAERFPHQDMDIIPAPSAFSLAAAKLRWPLAGAVPLSLHGRLVALLHPHVTPCARLLILGTGAQTPADIAALLRARGYGRSRLWVLEHLGGAAERIRETRARGFAMDNIAPLNMIAVECLPETGAPLMPATPGLPDEAFVHDGNITKRQVRAATLAALAPFPGALLWDIGAGCGSISVEWMRAHPRNRAIAVEPRASRRAMIARNRDRLGVPGLQIVNGRAPDILRSLAPDNDPHAAPGAVFAGGGIATSGVLEHCWNALAPGGRLVANAVTLEGEQALAAFRKHTGGTLVRMAVSRERSLGTFIGWQALAAVTQLESIRT